MDRDNGASSMRRRRAVRLIATLSIGLIAASFVPGPATGAEEEKFVNGSGVSYAQVYRVGPTAGRLSLAPIIGLSLADYLNTVGRGETKLVDWAGIGVAQPGLPENTPTLKVVSTQKGAEDGKTETPQGESQGPPSGGGQPFELFARATDSPWGESRIRISTLSIPGLIEAHGNESHSTTGIVKDGLREATATTQIDELSIASGAVTLRGLRWNAIQQTGAKETVAGKFTVEGVAIGGVPLPVPQGSDLAAVIGPMNTALAPTGFAISLPQIEKAGGQATVTPLSLDIVNSPLGRQFLAPILEAIHPAREPVVDAFIEIAKQLEEGGAPDLTVGVLAADLTLGIFSGSSQLHIEFGGVTAFTEGALFDNPFGSFDLEPPSVAPTQTIVTPGTPGTPAVTGKPGAVDDEGELVASSPIGQAAQRTVKGDKGGVAVAVGLIGLAVALGLAVADWYRMRASRMAEA